VHQVIIGNTFDRLAGLAPSAQSSHDHKRIEASFPQQVRHTGAGRFARSSTVDVNILVLREIFNFLFQIVRLDADGTPNPRRS
jgi:hypothetical protein